MQDNIQKPFLEWCNDARFVLLILLLIYTIYQYYAYVKPVQDAADECKEAIRQLSYKEVAPILRNKIKKEYDKFLENNRGCPNIFNMSYVKEKVGESVSDEFKFIDLPEPCEQPT